MTIENGRIAIFLHDGAYDKVHQGFSIAVSAALAGRKVDIYFFWWALDRLIRDELDLPDFGPEKSAIIDAFESGSLPTLRRLLDAAKSTGNVELFACSGSLAILGRTAETIQGKVDQLIGWTTILARTNGVVDRFFL